MMMNPEYATITIELNIKFRKVCDSLHKNIGKYANVETSKHCTATFFMYSTHGILVVIQT